MLPAFIIRRIPFRFRYDNNYFDDPYQGIPQGGYNKLTAALLQDVEVRLNTDFFEERSYWESIAKKIVFTGCIDEFFDFMCGKLEYRSLQFTEKYLENCDFQGNAVVNYTEIEVPYTRIIEHKYFDYSNQPNTVITYEYPLSYGVGREPYYPINDTANSQLFLQYKEMARQKSNVLFGGRLAQYTYADMDDTIESALQMADAELLNKHAEGSFICYSCLIYC